MKNKIKTALVMLVAATLSSCSLYRSCPTPQLPTTPICGTEVQLVASDSTISYRELFTDAHLQALIQNALINNVDMKVAGLNVKQAEAALMTSKLTYLPSFFLSPQGGVSQVSGGQKASYTYTVPVSAQWELDLWGKVRNSKQQAKAALQQTEEYRDLVQTQLVASVANMYYSLLFLDRQWEITQQTIHNFQENLQTVRAMKEAGMQNEIAVNQLEASYLSLLTSANDLNTQIKLTENSLALLVNETPQSIERSRYESVENPKMVVSNTIALTQLASRPDVKMAESALRQSFYGVNAARSAFYPALSINANIGWTNNIGVVINPAKFLYSAIATLTEPLFNKGVNVANLKIAKAEYEKSILQFEHALLSAGNEVNGLLTQYNNSVEKNQLRLQQVDASRKAYENSKVLMQYSSITYLDVLTAESAYLNAQVAQASDWLEQQQACINLYRALGGGVQ